MKISSFKTLGLAFETIDERTWWDIYKISDAISFQTCESWQKWWFLCLIPEEQCPKLMEHTFSGIFRMVQCIAIGQKEKQLQFSL